QATPGRCVVLPGAARPGAVRAARIGGRRPGTGPVGAAARITAVTWQGLGRPLPAEAPAASDEDANMTTDLSALVDAIAAAATRLGIPRQRSPWLPPLATTVTLDELSV